MITFTDEDRVKIQSSHDVKFLKRIVARPDCPDDLLMWLVDNRGIEIGSAVARREVSSEKVLRHVMNSSFEITSSLARNPHAPEWVLRELISGNEGQRFMRVILSYNRKCPTNVILDILESTRSSVLKSSAVRHPNFPISMLLEWVDSPDTDQEVLFEAVRHPEFPPERMKDVFMVANTAGLQISEAYDAIMNITSNTRCPSEVLEFIHERIRERPGTLEAEDVYLNLLRNSNTPADILLSLYEKYSKSGRYGDILDNPSCPVEVLERIISRNNVKHFTEKAVKKLKDKIPEYASLPEEWFDARFR